MSKLDDMFDTLGIVPGGVQPDTAEEFRAELTHAIKALFLELVGEDELVNSYFYDEAGIRREIQIPIIDEGSRVRAELRQRIEAL